MGQLAVHAELLLELAVRLSNPHGATRPFQKPSRHIMNPNSLTRMGQLAFYGAHFVKRIDILSNPHGATRRPEPRLARS